MIRRLTAYSTKNHLTSVNIIYYYTPFVPVSVLCAVWWWEWEVRVVSGARAPVPVLWHVACACVKSAAALCAVSLESGGAIAFFK